MAVFAVTGVASGIGLELAKVLKFDGNTVVGFDRVECSDAIDHFVKLDLSDDNAIEQAIKDAKALGLKFDGLCNNAGLPPRPNLEATILQVNFLGQRSFTNGLVSLLSEGGSVVNMASRAGGFWRDNVDQVKRLSGVADQDALSKFVVEEKIDSTRAYNLSKEAMILWTLAMNEDFIKKGLRINSVSPGGVATGIIDDFQRAFGDKMKKNVERAGRVGHAQEVAKVAAFMLSPDSHWIKGADIFVDGGMSGFNLSDQLGLDVLKSPLNI